MHKIYKVGLLLILINFLFGCETIQTRKDAVSGFIGCPPSEITIINKKSWGEEITGVPTWTAKCRGRTYRCSGGYDMPINCSKAL